MVVVATVVQTWFRIVRFVSASKEHYTLGCIIVPEITRHLRCVVSPPIKITNCTRKL